MHSYTPWIQSQFLADKRVRQGEVGIVYDKDGVMRDAQDDIDDWREDAQ